MKKNIINKIVITLLFFGVLSCSDSYFDVNTPSETASVDELRINDIIGPVIYSTFQAQRSAELVFGNYTQNFVSEGGGASGETTASGLWSQVYLDILPNVKTIKDKAAASNATHYNAIADILTAVNIGLLTDTFDNIPYSEAAFGEANLLPAFDTQEDIYNDIFSLLNSAITALEAPDNSNTDISDGGDIVYNGDTDKWLRAAYTIKARYQLHLVNKGTVSANDVLTTIANGFTSNSDNFTIDYSGTQNISPWYASEILTRATGNFHHDIASQLVSSMNGDNYPFLGITTVDPRLPMFATNNGEAEWKGFVSGGEGLSPDGTDANTGFAENGYYTSEFSKLNLITYAEAMFIKAEASFLNNGGNTTSTGSNAVAYTAYIDGINASMAMFGADATDYIADGSVAVGEAGLMLNHIMKEKYITNFLNPETFVDFRRYDFSDDVFKGLTIREEADPGDYAGQWFRRASYPSSEFSTNPTNTEANQQSPVTPVWWDN